LQFYVVFSQSFLVFAWSSHIFRGVVQLFSDSFIA
jgi:hypothetical protein